MRFSHREAETVPSYRLHTNPFGQPGIEDSRRGRPHLPSQFHTLGKAQSESEGKRRNLAMETTWRDHWAHRTTSKAAGRSQDQSVVHADGGDMSIENEITDKKINIAWQRRSERGSERGKQTNGHGELTTAVWVAIDMPRIPELSNLH